MRFRFGKQSGLNRIILRKEIARYSYIPRNEGSKPEHILVYHGKIPTQTEEPDLYRNATAVIPKGPEEVELNYRGIEEVVYLLTLKADNRFRRENPEIVARNELFVINE